PGSRRTAGTLARRSGSRARLRARLSGSRRGARASYGRRRSAPSSAWGTPRGRSRPMLPVRSRRIVPIIAVHGRRGGGGGRPRLADRPGGGGAGGPRRRRVVGGGQRPGGGYPSADGDADLPVGRVRPDRRPASHPRRPVPAPVPVGRPERPGHARGWHADL